MTQASPLGLILKVLYKWNCTYLVTQTKTSENQETHVVSFQLAQDLFGLLLGLSLFLFDINDGRGSHAWSVSLAFIAACVCVGDTELCWCDRDSVRHTRKRCVRSTGSPTSLFHHHVSGPLFKNGVRLDELLMASAPASHSGTPTSIRFLPLSPLPIFNFCSSVRK